MWATEIESWDMDIESWGSLDKESNYRIMGCLRLEETTGGHLVQPPAQEESVAACPEPFQTAFEDLQE